MIIIIKIEFSFLMYPLKLIVSLEFTLQVTRKIQLDEMYRSTLSAVLWHTQRDILIQYAHVFTSCFSSELNGLEEQVYSLNHW